MTGTTTNQRLTALGRRVGAGPRARRRALVRRHARGVRPALRRPGRGRDVHAARRGQAARTATGPTPTPATSPASKTARSSARPPRPRPARTTTGVTRPRCAPSSPRSTGAPCGAARCTSSPSRWARSAPPSPTSACSSTDSAVRRREHADHDPHGPGRPRRAGRRRVGAVPALRRRAAGGRRGRRAVALQPRQQVHRPLPRDPGDLELRLRLRRQRAAGQEVLRPAHRLGDGPRRRLAGRAHADPQADQPRRARCATSPPPSRRPAARPTWPCSCRPSPAGRSRPWATTSAG